MTINFEQLKVYTDIAHKNSEVVDVKEKIADHIYKNSNGIANYALAMKIYNSTGDCELTEQEYAMLMAFVEQQCTPIVIDAFRNMKDNADNKE